MIHCSIPHQRRCGFDSVLPDRKKSDTPATTFFNKGDLRLDSIPSGADQIPMFATENKMELYPKSFSDLAISRSERFWLWLAGSNARWRGVSWIAAILWTGILLASRSDSPQIRPSNLGVLVQCSALQPLAFLVERSRTSSLQYRSHSNIQSPIGFRGVILTRRALHHRGSEFGSALPGDQARESLDRLRLFSPGRDGANVAGEWSADNPRTYGTRDLTGKVRFSPPFPLCRSRQRRGRFSASADARR